VKYNENVSTYIVDRPTGQTVRRIFTREGSDNTASRKGQTFSGTEIRSQKFGLKTYKFLAKNAPV